MRWQLVASLDHIYIYFSVCAYVRNAEQKSETGVAGDNFELLGYSFVRKIND